MNKRNKIIVSIVGITIVLLALLGITYAYYLTRIEGNTNTNSISITTADLKLEYGDGNGLLTAENIMPGKQVEFKTTGNETTTEKTFTVTNSGNSIIEGYAVSLDYAYIANTMPSVFERPEDLKITLTCTTNRTGETCNGFTGNFNNESIMLTSNDIEKDEVHTYSLSIFYNDPGVDQSNDMGKNLNLKIQIYGISETTDIEGTIRGVDLTYALRIESDPKVSTIVNGKYSFKGVEIGTHILTVLDKDGSEIDKEYIVVKSGTSPGITTTKVTIDDEEVDAIEITITTEQRITKLSAKVENNILSFDISESSTTIYNPYSNNTNSLAYNIVNNAIIAKKNDDSTKTIYSPTSITKAGEINGETERTLSITQDDYGDSYYYRGNIIDNYVNYSGMCWRIVRIQGDGGVKLVLADENEECNSNTYSTDNTVSAFINDGSKYSFAIYSYNYNNEQDALLFENSEVLTQLNNWNEEKKLDLTKLTEAEWCTDTSINDSDIDEWGSGYVNYGIDRYTLKCDMTGKDDSTTTKYKTYIGSVTVDEVAFGGGATSRANTNNYLYINAQSDYWTITPWGYDTGDAEGYAYIITSTNQYYISDSIDGDDSNGNEVTASIRPSVVLKKDITISGGEGTQSNPYIIG